MYVPVSVLEDLLDPSALGGLCEPDHVLGAADLHEREPRLLRQRGRNRGFTYYILE